MHSVNTGSVLIHWLRIRASAVGSLYLATCSRSLLPSPYPSSSWLRGTRSFTKRKRGAISLELFWLQGLNAWSGNVDLLLFSNNLSGYRDWVAWSGNVDLLHPPQRTPFIRWDSMGNVQWKLWRFQSKENYLRPLERYLPIFSSEIFPPICYFNCCFGSHTPSTSFTSRHHSPISPQFSNKSPEADHCTLQVT